MYSNFKEQAIEYIKQAVQEDNAGNYVKAFPLYMNALEYFKTHLKYEKNPKIKEAITQKFTEYLRRAEEIRAVLDEGGPSPGPNGDAAVAVKPKSKGKGGGGDGDDDPEKEKLRAGLNSAIIREKPNVQWNDVAGLESAKQALQEAVILPVKYPQFFTGKMETSTESPTPTNLEDTTLGGASSIQSNTIGETIAKDKDEKNDVEAADGGENKRGIEKTQVDMRQYALRNARSVDGKLHISNYVFDQEKARSDLARMIIMHEYPLSIVDHIGFIEFCQSLQPAFTPVSRNTIKCDIMKIFHVEKVSLMKLLDKNKSRIAITSDMWTTSNQKKGYMVVTAHFIDDSWVLQSRIMRFIYVPCPHTSDVLAECLVTCFLDWNIDRKLSTITLDNCSTNDKIMDILKDRLRKSSLMLNGDMIHMRCCAHILNLIVQDGLSVINQQIIRIRDSVSFWTATPKRLEKFEIAAEQLEISCSKKLILDCKTRWNSTYTMIIIALAYKDVFPRLQQRETLYKCLPTDKDWELAKEICDRLKIFYDVTKLFSGSQYPTANIYFPQICEIRLALSKWVVSDISVVSEMANKMVTKYEKYWSMIHGIMGIAAVFDPRYKFALLEFYYDDIFGENAEEEINKIRSLCYKFLNEYELKEKMVSRFGKNNSSSSSHSQATQSGSIEGSFTSLPRFDEYLKRKISKANTKSELDRYLEEPMLPISDSFDILAWWKTTGIRYPIMQMIARDIYAIPISTVASESAFSTSGRLISPHRSRLHPTTLEALMCCQSWLTASSSKHGVIPNMDNDSDTDEGVGNNDQKVLVLAATNTPYALDQAIRRRFDKRIYIPLPDAKARQHMFKVHLGDTPHNLTESDFEVLARKTEGFSGSDIAVCVKDVLFEPVRKTQDAMYFIKASDGMLVPCGPKQPGAVETTMEELASKGLASKILPPPITRTDFDKVLARQRPTVSKKDLEVHEKFTKEFGEEG